eukprot:TRINITY_DN20543_c0_g1_i1.p1 TRINITY_DN20543_c0_g1~~TRINITY_DN20543_c0_g1_i1.p1  ORF type:complete len:253 (-),score=42.28 TRINITY_DN20543_c0_g1_i1:243-1001(-)
MAASWKELLAAKKDFGDERERYYGPGTADFKPVREMESVRLRKKAVLELAQSHWGRRNESYRAEIAKRQMGKAVEGEKASCHLRNEIIRHDKMMSTSVMKSMHGSIDLERKFEARMLDLTARGSKLRRNAHDQFMQSREEANRAQDDNNKFLNAIRVHKADRDREIRAAREAADAEVDRHRADTTGWTPKSPSSTHTPRQRFYRLDDPCGRGVGGLAGVTAFPGTSRISPGQAGGCRKGRPGSNGGVAVSKH